MTGEQSLVWAMNIGEQLLKNGAEISRVEDTVSRICLAYGARQQHVFCVASCLIVTVEDADGAWRTQSRRIREFLTDMDKLDRINNLSREICGRELSQEEMEERYREIIGRPGYSVAARCVIFAMVAAAFTLFFGGNFKDAAAAAPVGAVLNLITWVLFKLHINQVFASTLSALFCGTLAIFMCRLGLGENLDKIFIGNIMLLIPGVLLTNSFRDLISGDMLTGLMHFSEAIITAIAVAAGFALAMIIWGGGV